MSFILRTMGSRSPKFSILCRLGPITLSKGIGFPIFSQISLILVDFHPFLPHIFPVFALCTPIFADFMLQASLLTLSFCSFYLSGTPVMLLSSRGSGFGTQLPPKVGSLVETFLLAPFLSATVHRVSKGEHQAS